MLKIRTNHMLNSLPGEMGKKLSSAIAKSARSERTVGLAVRQPTYYDDACEKHERKGCPGVDHGCDLDGIADE